FSVGSDIPILLPSLASFRVCFYHNITPPQFFTDPGDVPAQQACALGLFQMGLVRCSTEASWTVSSFNAKELIAAGFSQPVVSPILRNYATLLDAPLDAKLE